MKMYCTVYNDGSSYVAYENLPRKKLPNYESNNIKSSSIDESEKRIDEIADFINSYPRELFNFNNSQNLFLDELHKLNFFKEKIQNST